MAVISDDGRVLLEDTPRDLLTFYNPSSISPSDIVGRYEADSFISSFDLARLTDDRLAMGNDVAREDMDRFPIPLDNLTANMCIDVGVSPSAPRDEIEAAWSAAYDGIMREAAAELAVRRQLRDKRIGIRD